MPSDGIKQANAGDKERPVGKPSVVYWIIAGLVSVMTIFAGVALFIGSFGFWPTQIRGSAFILAGVAIFPLVGLEIRRRARPLRAVWWPPIIAVALFVIGNWTASAVEPRGAARKPYIDAAIADANTYLAEGAFASASDRLSQFQADAKNDPRLVILNHRIADAEMAKKRSDDQVADANKPQPPPSPDPASLATTGDAGTPPNTPALADAELAYRVSSIAAVKAQLRDPDSARFDSVVAYGKAGGYHYYCGIVNAKNGFGGYSGGQMFFVLPQVGAQIDSGTRSFKKTWKELCSDTSQAQVVDFNSPN